MNILIRELKSNRRSLMIWAGAIAIFSFFMLAIYPSFAADAQQLEDLIAMYPEGFMQVFGLDRLNMAEAIGFYAVETYFMILLFGGMYAVIIGSTMLAKEEDEKTIEFLLAKPVTRNHVITSKLLAIITYLLLFNAAIGMVTLVGFEAFGGDYSLAQLLRLLVAPVFVHLTLASLGFLLSLFFTRKKTSYSAGIGLVLLLYFLNVIATLADRFSILRWLSPFFYMDAADIVMEGALNPLHIFILLGASTLAVTTTYMLYNRRDITI